LLQAQRELDALGQDLAHEKMARASAEADLDAVKNKKVDTSEVDSLRKELQDLKDQHRTSLIAAQQQAEKATDEHNATKASLDQVKARLEGHKTETEAKLKTSQDDYLSMHSSLTELAEEAHKKAADLEARLSEAQAELKVKEAELTEAKVRVMYYTCI
jgi:chromosome segregation ATPase